MTRAYIRLDPSFDERKESYPDGPYASLIATFCLAEHQPERGRFRSLDYLRRLLGHRGRHLRFLEDHGDVTELLDGRAYVDGWDEWQEGDWKVAERVERIRRRPHGTAPVTPVVTAPVTVDVTLHPTKAVGADSLSGSAGISVAGAELSAGGDSPPPEDEQPEFAVLQWLSGHGCYVAPGNGYHRNLITGVERHGAVAVIAAMDRLARAGTKNGDTKGFVFKAIDMLDTSSRPTVLEIVREEAEERTAASSKRQVDVTMRKLHEGGAHQETPRPNCPLCKAVAS